MGKDSGGDAVGGGGRGDKPLCPNRKSVLRKDKQKQTSVTSSALRCTEEAEDC